MVFVTKKIQYKVLTFNDEDQLMKEETFNNQLESTIYYEQKMEENVANYIQLVKIKNGFAEVIREGFKVR